MLKADRDFNQAMADHDLNRFVSFVATDAVFDSAEGRGKDAPETIDRRMAGAREDISHVLEFEYIIVNERFEAALSDLISVVHATRVSRAQQAVRLASLLGEFK